MLKSVQTKDLFVGGGFSVVEPLSRRFKRGYERRKEIGKRNIPGY